MGRGFVKVGTEKPDPEDVRMVEDAWTEADRAIQSGQWDLVILDGFNYAITYGILDPAKAAAALKKRPTRKVTSHAGHRAAKAFSMT